MIGVIRRPNWKKNINPDDYFNPITHIATEADFIAFLANGGGQYTSTSLVGYKVVLSNLSVYNNGEWIIIDKDHDSANTGQTNCYDLISKDLINPNVNYGSNNDLYRNSNIRTYLANTVFGGFSNDLKSHILNIKYNSHGDWYSDDKIVEPSAMEIFGVNERMEETEIGSQYPIFTDDASRIKYYNSTADYWWTRSRDITNAQRVCLVNDSGIIRSLPWDSGSYGGVLLAPVIRVA